MISSDTIIAASLGLEPDRAAVVRDVHRAAVRGIENLLVNENMVSLAVEEARNAGLDIKISGLVAYPIGQWIWPAKSIAIEELSAIQNGPAAVMHAVGPWLDETEPSREEFSGLSALQQDKWVMTSLTAIPEGRLAALAGEIAGCGASLLMTSNGVAASGLPLPTPEKISAMAAHACGRFKLAAMAPAGCNASEATAYLKAGADKVICADFWTLTSATCGK